MFNGYPLGAFYALGSRNLSSTIYAGDFALSAYNNIMKATVRRAKKLWVAMNFRLQIFLKINLIYWRYIFV